jgi:hypothetical protein
VFAVARGEVLEAEAALDVAVLFGAIGDGEAARVRGLMARLGQMLSRLSR